MSATHSSPQRAVIPLPASLSRWRQTPTLAVQMRSRLSRYDWGVRERCRCRSLTEPRWIQTGNPALQLACADSRVFARTRTGCVGRACARQAPIPIGRSHASRSCPPANAGRRPRNDQYNQADPHRSNLRLAAIAVKITLLVQTSPRSPTLASVIHNAALLLGWFVQPDKHAPKSFLPRSPARAPPLPGTAPA